MILTKLWVGSSLSGIEKGKLDKFNQYCRRMDEHKGEFKDGSEYEEFIRDINEKKQNEKEKEIEQHRELEREKQALQIKAQQELVKQKELQIQKEREEFSQQQKQRKISSKVLKPQDLIRKEFDFSSGSNKPAVHHQHHQQKDFVPKKIKKEVRVRNEHTTSQDQEPMMMNIVQNQENENEDNHQTQQQNQQREHFPILNQQVYFIH